MVDGRPMERWEGQGKAEVRGGSNSDIDHRWIVDGDFRGGEPEVDGGEGED